MGDTASLGSFIARSSEACAAVVIAERHPSDQPGWLVVVSPVPTLLAPGGGANIIVTARGVESARQQSARGSPHVRHVEYLVENNACARAAFTFTTGFYIEIGGHACACTVHRRSTGLCLAV